MDFRSMLQKKKYASTHAKEQPPDWGDLKPVEKEPETVLKKVEKVGIIDNGRFLEWVGIAALG